MFMTKLRPTDLTTTRSTQPHVLAPDEWPFSKGPYVEVVACPPGSVVLGNGQVSTGTVHITCREHLKDGSTMQYRYNVFPWSTGGDEDLIARDPNIALLPPEIPHHSPAQLDVIGLLAQST